MAKKFNVLRSLMSPERQARNKEAADQELVRLDRKPKKKPRKGRA